MAQQELKVVYEVDGQKIVLTPDTVRRYLVSGEGVPTDKEVINFIMLCRYQKLNPYLGDCYISKKGREHARIMVSKDVHVKRAQRHPKFRGFECGVIVRLKDSGDVLHRMGTFVNERKEELVGGWARVYRSDWETVPIFSVNFREYEGRTEHGPNYMWASKPATMIQKVAIAQALRTAFPEDLRGLYCEEEMSPREVEGRLGATDESDFEVVRPDIMEPQVEAVDVAAGGEGAEGAAEPLTGSQQADSQQASGEAAAGTARLSGSEEKAGGQAGGNNKEANGAANGEAAAKGGTPPAGGEKPPADTVVRAVLFGKSAPDSINGCVFRTAMLADENGKQTGVVLVGVGRQGAEQFKKYPSGTWHRGVLRPLTEQEAKTVSFSGTLKEYNAANKFWLLKLAKAQNVNAEGGR